MKRTIACACACLCLSGCGLINTGPKEVDPEFEAWINGIVEARVEYYRTLRDTPRMKMKLPAPGGGFYELESYDKPEWHNIAQVKDSEWAKPVEKAIGGATIVGSILSGAKFAESILSAAMGSTYNTGGGNLSLSNVGNENIAVGSGTHSIHGQENPTTFLLLEGD